jgi:hypothetical protein
LGQGGSAIAAPSRTRAVFAAGLSTLLVLWLAWQVVANTMADSRAALDPEGALSWRADDASALVALANQQLAAGGDAAGAEMLARRALRADPLESSALVTLGTAADARGETDAAGRLMALAASLSPRNGGAQMWLFSQRLREHDYAEAMARADVILRAQPDLADQLSPSLVALAAEPAARPALAAALAANPPWRGWYLGALARGADSPAVTYELLASIPGGIGAGELSPYLNRIIRDGDYSLALLAWMHFLPPGQAATVPYAFNGGFELPVSGLPFDWTFTRLAGASMDVVETGDGHALRVVFSGRDLRFRNVAKLLVLPPGRYELRAKAKTEDLTTHDGLEWTVACADGDRHQLAASAPIVDTAGKWQPAAVAFEVPPAGCRGQWLRLESAAEEPIRGAAYFDDIEIRRSAVAVN